MRRLSIRAEKERTAAYHDSSPAERARVLNSGRFTRPGLGRIRSKNEGFRRKMVLWLKG